jgi:large subunit ribosomal protein L9
MKYQVLLLEDIVNKGRKGDVVSVLPGFARNFLLPFGKALLATKSTLKMRERLKNERDEQAAKDKVEAERLAAKIRGLSFETITKVDPDGHMYGSISSADIAEILEKQGYKVEKRHIVLHHPIKQLGNYQINLRLPEGVEASVGLVVKPDREIKKVEKQKAEKAAPEAEADKQPQA